MRFPWCRIATLLLTAIFSMRCVMVVVTFVVMVTLGRVGTLTYAASVTAALSNVSVVVPTCRHDKCQRPSGEQEVRNGFTVSHRHLNQLSAIVTERLL